MIRLIVSILQAYLRIKDPRGKQARGNRAEKPILGLAGAAICSVSIFSAHRGAMYEYLHNAHGAASE